VNSPDRNASNNWKRELQPTSECLPIARLSEELTAPEREHLAHCARCEAEMSLWEKVRNAEAAPSEGLAVQWIEAELRRRLAGAPGPGRRRRWWEVIGLRPRTLAAVATVVVAVGVGLVIQNREPAVDLRPGSEDAYRSAQVRVVGPVGDRAAAPTELQWVPVAGAARYDVAVEEVDHTILWRGSASGPRVELPAAVVAQCVPAKTILWHVTARNVGGAVLAQSGTQRFRVAPEPGAGPTR
jgi:hypothetical protein